MSTHILLAYLILTYIRHYFLNVKFNVSRLDYLLQIIYLNYVFLGAGHRRGYGIPCSLHAVVTCLKLAPETKHSPSASVV